MEEGLPSELRAALAARPMGSSLDQLLEDVAALSPPLVMAHLRSAERAGAVRYVRGRYELLAQKLTLGDTTDAGLSLAAAPEEDPEEAPDDPPARQMKPAVTATMAPPRETKPAIAATKAAKPATIRPEKDTPAMATRECKTCHAVKNHKEFPPNKSCKDGIEPRCRECKSKRQREAYAAKTDKPAARPKAAPARANGHTAAALSIPASDGLSAALDGDGQIVLNQGEATIGLLPVQMDQLVAWWKAQAHG